MATKNAIWPSRRASITSPSRRQILKMLPVGDELDLRQVPVEAGSRFRKSQDRRTRCSDIPPSRSDFTTRSATRSRKA